MAKQNCTLSCSELNELSGRLFVLADYTLADRQAAADMRNAARAITDLASLRFSVEEIVAEMNKYVQRVNNRGATQQVETFAGELLALLGYGESDIISVTSRRLGVLKE